MVLGRRRIVGGYRTWAKIGGKGLLGIDGYIALWFLGAGWAGLGLDLDLDVDEWMDRID